MKFGLGGRDFKGNHEKKKAHVTCLEQWVVNVVKKKKKKEEIEQKAERPGPGSHVWSLYSSN